jgi:S1/P1 Nuclease
MKFLLHLVGDIHQPLHVEDLCTGGNQVCVKWKGRTTNTPEYYEGHASDDHSDRFHSGQAKSSRVNPLKENDHCKPWPKCRNLHQVWDSSMIEELLDWTPPSREEDPHETMEKARALQWAHELFSDDEGNPDLAPRDCVPVGTKSRAQACALKWAGESNDLICSFVLKDGLEAVKGKELSGSYYEGAVPIIKSQITRAARRFAATLNAIAAVSSDDSRGDGQLVLHDL